MKTLGHQYSSDEAETLILTSFSLFSLPPWYSSFLFTCISWWAPSWSYIVHARYNDTFRFLQSL